MRTGSQGAEPLDSVELSKLVRSRADSPGRIQKGRSPLITIKTVRKRAATTEPKASRLVFFNHKFS